MFIKNRKANFRRDFNKLISVIDKKYIEGYLKIITILSKLSKKEI